MTDEHERFVEDLAAYALESLEAAERTRIEAHVATCATCAGHLAEYRAVIGTLPIGLEPASPPPAAWVAIRAAASPRPRRVRRWAFSLPDGFRVARWPALAALVASLVVWNVTLQRDLARRSPGPAPGPDVEALARRPGRVVILVGSGAPGTSARLFVASDGGHGHLAISGLRPLPRARAYHLWFIRTGAPSMLGAAFDVDARGRAWVSVELPATLDDVREIAVTEEPLPASVAPTGRRLLDAQPWR